MCLFDGDYQRPRFIRAVGAEGVGLLFPGLTDLAGEQVGDQQVIEVCFVIAEREDDVPSILQSFDDLLE